MGHCVNNMKMISLALSARQWPSDRGCGRSGVLENCVLSELLLSFMFSQWGIYSSFNNWSAHSVFKNKDQTLPTKQVLYAHRLRKICQMFTEKCHLQHRSRKIVNCILEVFDAHSIHQDEKYNFPCFPWGCDQPFDLQSPKMWSKWTATDRTLKPVLSARLILFTSLEEQIYNFFAFPGPEAVSRRYGIPRRRYEHIFWPVFLWKPKPQQDEWGQR